MRLIVGLLLGVILLFVGLSLLGSTADDGEPTSTPTPTQPAATEPLEPVEVLRIEGAANTQTDDFTTVNRWKLHWDIPDDGAGIIVRVMDSATDEQVGKVSPDPGQGESLFRQSCRCYLDISTFGSSFTVWVIDEP